MCSTMCMGRADDQLIATRTFLFPDYYPLIIFIVIWTTVELGQQAEHQCKFKLVNRSPGVYNLAFSSLQGLQEQTHRLWVELDSTQWAIYEWLTVSECGPGESLVVEEFVGKLASSEHLGGGSAADCGQDDHAQETTHLQSTKVMLKRRSVPNW